MRNAQLFAAVIKRMMPPENCSLVRLGRETGISETALYYWCKAARERGVRVPNSKAMPDQWSSADKFAVVLEAAAMNAADLSTYCRQKGLLVEQVNAWRDACASANLSVDKSRAEIARERQVDKKRVRELERELRRKEKALAEAAALLVLRKKLEAFYSESEDD
jgi:transposase-like protein